MDTEQHPESLLSPETTCSDPVNSCEASPVASGTATVTTICDNKPEVHGSDSANADSLDPLGDIMKRGSNDSDDQVCVAKRIRSEDCIKAEHDVQVADLPTEPCQSETTKTPEHSRELPKTSHIDNSIDNSISSHVEPLPSNLTIDPVSQSAVTEVSPCASAEPSATEPETTKAHCDDVETSGADSPGYVLC